MPIWVNMAMVFIPIGKGLVLFWLTNTSERTWWSSVVNSGGYKGQPYSLQIIGVPVPEGAIVSTTGTSGSKGIRLFWEVGMENVRKVKLTTKMIAAEVRAIEVLFRHRLLTLFILYMM